MNFKVGLIVASLCVPWAMAQAPGNKPPENKAPAVPNPEKTDVLRQLSTSFEEILQRSGRAVVQIFQAFQARSKAAGYGWLAAACLLNLPSLGFANQKRRKQRLVVLFSPNGTVPSNFWPDQEGARFTFKEVLKPLEPFRSQTLVLKGVCDKVRGDGDNHMRGIGCLLTGVELFPGNIQGGSDTPAGWASGLSIDQEIKNVLQKQPATRTRFGSLEFGVMVPERADTWTRMVYSGPNKPVAPIDNPYQMFAKLYGRAQDREALASILDGLTDDLKKVGSAVSADGLRGEAVV